MEASKGYSLKQKEMLWRERVLPILPLVGLVLIFAIFGILTQGRFLQWGNLLQILRNCCTLTCAACGATFVIAQGNMDMSLGGIILISGTFGLMASAINPYLLIPVAILSAVACECVVGGLHVLLKVPSFVSSMAVAFFSKGIATLILSTTGLRLPKVFNPLGKAEFGYIVLACIVVVTILLSKYTKLGKYTRAIGANRDTAAASGIPVNRYKMLGFIISGVTAGIAVLLYVFKARGVALDAGSGYQLSIILIMVLGQVPLTGGTKVKAWCAVVGGIMLLALENGMTMCGVSPAVNGLVQGIVFIGSVSLTFDRKSQNIIE